MTILNHNTMVLFVVFSFCSDEGLCSRCPTVTESVFYGIKTGVPVFLPAHEEDPK